MNKDKLNYFRNKLLQERAEVTARLHDQTARTESETVRESLDPREAAEEFAELVTHDALVDSEENLLEKIDLALKRIDDCSYGRCLICAELIPNQRLEAKPSASTCIQCQASKEAGAALIR